MIFGLLALALVVVLLVRRARRTNVLAGRVAERPVYSVEPPTRRVGARKREAL